MRVIIAGSRTMMGVEQVLIADAVTRWTVRFKAPTEIVCGMARGADALGRAWALDNCITVHEMSADWGRYPRAAGMIRNQQMATYADGLIIFIYGTISHGSEHMLRAMKQAGKPCMVYRDGLYKGAE